MIRVDADAILSNVSFPGMKFFVGDKNGVLYLQIEASTPCNVTGRPHTWRSRKWMLSQHMTKSELVQTAFKATLTALEHEAREQFTYMGQAIFDPHYDVDKLVALRRAVDTLEVRE